MLFIVVVVAAVAVVSVGFCSVAADVETFALKGKTTDKEGISQQEFGKPDVTFEFHASKRNFEKSIFSE